MWPSGFVLRPEGEFTYGCKGGRREVGQGHDGVFRPNLSVVFAFFSVSVCVSVCPVRLFWWDESPRETSAGSCLRKTHGRTDGQTAPRDQTNPCSQIHERETRVPFAFLHSFLCELTPEACMPSRLSPQQSALNQSGGERKRRKRDRERERDRFWLCLCNQ